MAFNPTTLNKSFPAGTPVTVTITGGEVIEGEMIKATAKGVSIKVDGKTTTRAYTRIDGIERTPEAGTVPDVPAGLFEDAESYTTAQVAAALGIAARELRIKLREYKMGVGKGQTYTFTPSEARNLFRKVQADTGE